MDRFFKELRWTLFKTLILTKTKEDKRTTDTVTKTNIQVRFDKRGLNVNECGTSRDEWLYFV